MGKKTIDDAEIGELLGRIPADSALGSCGDNERVGEGWMIPIGKRLRALVERMNRAEHAAKSLGDALQDCADYLANIPETAAGGDDEAWKLAKRAAELLEASDE